MGSFNVNFDQRIRKIRTEKQNTFATFGVGSYITEGTIPDPDITPLHILVGSYSSIAAGNIFLIAQNHYYRAVTTYPFYIALKKFKDRKPSAFKERRQVIIGNDVWMGINVTVFGGIRIGDGAVVAANATVTKDVPPYSIVAGLPARVIKYRFEPEIIRKLLAIKWWDWDQEKIFDNYDLLNDPRAFVEKFYSPELEMYPRDEVGNHLRNLKSHGVRIFSSILDFDSKFPLWKKVMEDFSASRLSNATLICYAEKSASDEDFREAIDFSDQFSANIIVSDFSIDALRETDIFITTKEFNSMLALDFLPHDIEVRFALDDIVFF